MFRKKPKKAQKAQKAQWQELRSARKISLSGKKLEKIEGTITHYKNKGKGTFGSAEDVLVVFEDGTEDKWIKKKVIDHNIKNLENEEQQLKNAELLIGVEINENVKHEYEYFMPDLGKSLVKIFGKALNTNEILFILQGLLHSVVLLHEKGIVHSDIAPKNIGYKRSTGQVNLFDFNLSFMASDEKKHSGGSRETAALEAYYDIGQTLAGDDLIPSVPELDVLKAQIDDLDTAIRKMIEILESKISQFTKKSNPASNLSKVEKINNIIGQQSNHSLPYQYCQQLYKLLHRIELLKNEKTKDEISAYRFRNEIILTLDYIKEKKLSSVNFDYPGFAFPRLSDLSKSIAKTLKKGPSAAECLSTVGTFKTVKNIINEQSKMLPLHFKR